ncbi:hypothetical protein Gpo141_00013383, partial [Globisporangium polare]
MLHMMKRQKLDSPPAAHFPPSLPGLERNTQRQQHVFYDSSNPTVRSYARLHQQLHLQQQVAATNGYPNNEQRNAHPADGRQAILRQQQQEQQAAPRRTQDRCPSTTSTRPYEKFQQQAQSYPTQNQMMVRSPLQMSSSSSSPFSTATCSSPVVTTPSPPASSTWTTAGSTSDSPPSLPGISSMLRMPSGSVPAEVRRPRSLSTSSNGNSSRLTNYPIHAPMAAAVGAPSGNGFDNTLAGHSPTLMQGMNCSSAPYKWTPEMTSMSSNNNGRTLMGNGYLAQHHHSAAPTSTTTHPQAVGNGYIRESQPSSMFQNLQPAAARSTELHSRHGSLDSLDGDCLSALVSSGSNSPRSQMSSIDESSTGHRTPSSTTDAEVRPVASATTTATPGEERIANPNKNSRYLREMDRRE